MTRKNTLSSIQTWISIYQRDLPERVYFYHTDGQIIFPILHTADGICYLIRQPKTKRGRWYKYGIRFKHVNLLSKGQICNQIEEGIRNFVKLLKGKKINLRNYRFDPNGGDLGTGDNK